MPQAVLKSDAGFAHRLIDQLCLQARMMLIGARELMALLALISGLGFGLISLAEALARVGLAN